MSLEIILMDSNKYIQKTLYYFLRHYAPVIYPFHSENKFPKTTQNVQPDIIFLDSEQINNKHHLDSFQNPAQPVPIVLLSKDDEPLKTPSSCQGKLKKPIDPKELQETIQKLVPKLKGLNIADFLKFYSHNESSSNSQKPLQEEKKSPEKIIPANQNEQIVHKKKDPLFFSKSIPIDDIIDNNQSTHSSSPKTKPLHFVKSKISQLESSSSQIHSKKIQNSSLKPHSSSSIKKSSVPLVEKTEEDQIQLTSPGTPLSDLKSQPFQKNSQKSQALTDTALKKIIIEIVEDKFQNDWNSSIKTQLTKEMTAYIDSTINKFFLNNIKETLHSQSLKIIKKASEDIAWKIIPELSKKLIQTEINKTSRNSK